MNDVFAHSNTKALILSVPNLDLMLPMPLRFNEVNTCSAVQDVILIWHEEKYSNGFLCDDENRYFRRMQIGKNYGGRL